MRVFVYESITGGSTLGMSQALPFESLLIEGRSMLTAVASDFAKVDGTDVVCLWDERLPMPNIADVEFQRVGTPADMSQRFDFHASQSDATLLVAPEFDGELLSRTRRVEQLGGRLLGPDSDFVALTSSKYKTACHLQQAGVRVPASQFYDRSTSCQIHLTAPAVVKPDDGAGSIAVQRVERPVFDISAMTKPNSICVQEFCPGRPASVSALGSQSSSICLPACWQNLQDDFKYLGGSLIEDDGLRARALRLAKAVVEALPLTRGWIGVDLVLGHQADGSADYAIEVNPRLTTSYVGLRQLSDQNLAHAMLATFKGQPIELSFRSTPLEFSASGKVWCELSDTRRPNNSKLDA